MKSWSFIMWLVGVLVALAVGFGLTSKVLIIPYIPTIVTMIAGWIVVVATIVGLIMAVISYIKNMK